MPGCDPAIELCARVDNSAAHHAAHFVVLSMMVVSSLAKGDAECWHAGIAVFFGMWAVYDNH